MTSLKNTELGMIFPANDNTADVKKEIVHILGY
jgi:hypothetical protein